MGHVVNDAPVACWRCGDGLEVAFEADMEDQRFAAGLGQQLMCRECRMVPPLFDRAVSYGTYSGELKALIRLLKFGRVPAVAKLLSRRLGFAILQLEGLAGDDLLVTAVPLFSRRQRQRGFNQSTLLANATLRWLKRERPQWKLTATHGLLARQRPTESSFGLSKRARRLNMAGAFRVQGDVRGRQVLLIDDILTTGATARECAKVLRKAGAERVWVTTLARSRRAIAREEQTAVWDLAATKVEQHAT